MVKKFLENKDAELLLVTQAIESTESARMKRPSQRPSERPATSKKNSSHKPRKLDAAKLAVKQQEKSRRIARKKSRQNEDHASRPGNPRPRGSDAEPGSDFSKAISSNAMPTSGRRGKRVSFA